MSLLLAVPAFTFKLADRFLIFLLALASLLGIAFAALTAFAFVELCAASAALPFLTAADVHCINLHCVRVCPDFLRALLLLMISSRSALYVASRLILRSMCHFNHWCAMPPHTIPCFLASLMRSLDCCSYLDMSRSNDSISPYQVCLIEFTKSSLQ